MTGVSEKQQPVRRGDVILTSTPFAYVLKEQFKGQLCDYCLLKKKLQRCTGCNQAWYCSPACQRGEWLWHKHECKCLKKVYPRMPTATTRLMARLIFRLKDGGEEFEEAVHANWKRKFRDLVSHYDDVKVDMRRMEVLTSVTGVLKEYIGEENLPDMKELIGIFGRMCVNCFGITDSDMNAIGTGLYVSASVFDNACNPNAFATWEGIKITVRSLIDWPQGFDWSKVRISYIDVMNCNEYRKKLLHKRYYFWCDCDHCADEKRGALMNAINCGNKTCSAPVPIDTTLPEESPIGPCPDCGYNNFNPKMRADYYEAAQFSEEKFDEMGDRTFLDVSRAILRLQGDLFHKLDVWHCKALSTAFDSAVDLKRFEEAEKYGEDYLEGSSFYYGGDHPSHAYALLRLGKLYVYHSKLKEALPLLEKAKSILSVSHGPDHYAYKEELLPLLKQAETELAFMAMTGNKPPRKEDLETRFTNFNIQN